MGKYFLSNYNDQALTHAKENKQKQTNKTMHGSAYTPSTVELGVGWIPRSHLLPSHSQVGELQVQ